MRKIRVICSDPYATDCSSDEEESIENKRPTKGKFFVQEISVLLPSINQLNLDATDSSSREDQPAKNGPFCQHPGIRKTPFGKWNVEIDHPTEGTTTCLGSHNTFEEAVIVYEEKKLEFELLSKLIKQKKPGVQSSKRNKREKFVLDDLTIFETVSGKWAAWILNPITNLKVWMGIYATPEEAVISYSKKKRGFDSRRRKPKNLEKDSPTVQCNAGTNNTNSPAQETDIASLKHPGVKLTKTGRWGVSIYHPTMKTRHWLGSYDTPEEAAEVFDKRKAELESSPTEVVYQESCSVVKRLSDASTVVMGSQGHPHLAYKGIRMRKSGRWCAEIKDPFKGKNTHIGTYDTPEEAADAYSKRKRELDEQMSLSKKQKCNDDDVGVVIKTESNENSTVTAVSSQNSEGSNNNNNDKQIPCASLLADDEFGFNVIDSYGRLIGEFCRIDDELWLTGPGNYYDECVTS